MQAKLGGKMGNILLEANQMARTLYQWSQPSIQQDKIPRMYQYIEEGENGIDSKYFNFWDHKDRIQSCKRYIPFGNHH